MRTKGAEPGAPPPSAAGRRLLSDLLSVFFIYLLSGAGLLLAGGFVMGAAEPGLELARPFLLLALLPLATLAIFAVQLRRLLRSMSLRRYGARLRLKLAGLFMGFILVAALPQAWFAFRLVGLAGELQGPRAAAAGMEGALRLMVEWQETSAARLEALARERLPILLDQGLRPEEVLARLQREDPALEALEIFGPGGRQLFAGTAGARLAAAPSSPGPLPLESRSGQSRLRQAVSYRGGLAVLCLRLPPDFEAATASLAEGRQSLREAAEASARWPSFSALIYLLFVLPLLLLGLLLGMASADLIAEPLAGLEEATRRIAAGDSSLRLLAKPEDERGWLISSFNRMLDELERGREGELIQERIDAWKDLAQRLAHELKNPLTPIRLASERLLRASRNDPEKARAITESTTLAIIAEVDGMDALLGDFREFARLPSPQRDWVPLEELLEEATAVFRQSYPEVEFALGRLPPGLRLNVDRAMLRRALGNLFGNAIEAMEGRGRIGISADLVKAGDSSYCRLRLSDSGRGIPAEIRDRVFLPYFTTKEKGTGLGLAIVERIVHDHGGRIRFESAEGLGTVFWLDLPVER